MRGPIRPVPVARLGVGLAGRALPTPADRERYTAEFLAELHGLPPSAQLRHAAGVLSQTFALRTALGASPSRGIEEAAMRPATTAGQRFRCRYLRRHHWQQFWTQNSESYTACVVCRKERAWDTPEVGGWVS